MKKVTIGWRVKDVGDPEVPYAALAGDFIDWRSSRKEAPPMTRESAVDLRERIVGLRGFVSWNPEDIRLVRVVRRARLCDKCGKGGGK